MATKTFRLVKPAIAADHNTLLHPDLLVCLGGHCVRDWQHEPANDSWMACCLARGHLPEAQYYGFEKWKVTANPLGDL